MCVCICMQKKHIARVEDIQEKFHSVDAITMLFFIHFNLFIFSLTIH